MAKDTEKLIRQLSLISYLMAERRPVTATEIRRDVEGYSGMNEDAFARRFYADRAELESLGIALSVDKPADGAAEQENYSLPPGEVLPARRSSSPTPSWRRCRPRCRCSTASSPTPSRCASRSSRSPGAGPTRSARPTSARSRSASPPAPAATTSPSAWPRSRPRSSAARRSPSSTTRSPATRSPSARSTPTAAVPGRPVLPRRPLARARRAARVPALAHPRQGRLRDQGRARLPAPRRTSIRAPTPPASDWQLGDALGTAEVEVDEPHRLADRAPLRPLRRGARRARPTGDRVRHPVRRRAPARRLGARARRARAAARPARARAPRLRERVELLVAAAHRRPRARRASAALGADATASRSVRRHTGNGKRRERRDPPRALRPPGHAGQRADRGRAAAASACAVGDVVDQLQITEQELREDVNVLNVVNFGGGSYVLYAEVLDDGADRGRPRALLGQLRPPRPPAAGAGQGARGGHRPDRRPHPRGLAGLRAREDRARPGRRPGHRGPAGRGRRRRRRRDRRHRVPRHRRPSRARARVLEGGRGRALHARGRALRPDEFARRLVPARLGPRPRRRALVPPRPHQGAPRRRRSTSSRAPRSTPRP